MRQVEEKDSKNDSDRKRRKKVKEVGQDEQRVSCNKTYWLNRFLIIVLFMVILLVFIIMQERLHAKHIELLDWLEQNAYSGPIIVMFVTLIESAFFMNIDFLNFGTGISLELAHEESVKAVFVGSLAIWTGFWIGTNLNA